ncbi:292_t:CDS:2, partial [Acaulospora colombiana]
CWLSFGSRRTSDVPMCFLANSITDCQATASVNHYSTRGRNEYRKKQRSRLTLTAQGALFLKERLCTRLWSRYERVLSIPSLIEMDEVHQSITAAIQTINTAFHKSSRVAVLIKIEVEINSR